MAVGALYVFQCHNLPSGNKKARVDFGYNLIHCLHSFCQCHSLVGLRTKKHSQFFTPISWTPGDDDETDVIGILLAMESPPEARYSDLVFAYPKVDGYVFHRSLPQLISTSRLLHFPLHPRRCLCLPHSSLGGSCFADSGVLLRQRETEPRHCHDALALTSLPLPHSNETSIPYGSWRQGYLRKSTELSVLSHSL